MSHALQGIFQFEKLWESKVHSRALCAFSRNSMFVGLTGGAMQLSLTDQPGVSIHSDNQWEL